MSMDIPGPDKLADLVSGVTETMFGMSFALAPPRDTSPWNTMPPWRTVLLPIHGRRPITVAIAADEQGGRMLGSRMFSCDAASVDASMIDDSLRELANIVAGQVKSVMGLDQALGLPTLGDPGQRLEMSTWRAATLQSPAERIVVWVAVSETPAT
jgi:hypothetical protein